MVVDLLGGLCEDSHPNVAYCNFYFWSYGQIQSPGFGLTVKKFDPMVFIYSVIWFGSYDPVSNNLCKLNTPTLRGKAQRNMGQSQNQNSVLF